MEIVRLNFVREPRGGLYQGLLDFALEVCETALLVVRDMKPLSLGDKGQAVLSQLEPFLKRKIVSSEWPGTIAFGWTAWVFYYTLTPESVEILKQSATGLYSWMQPDLPEDLCLLRGDGRPWLVSIADERDGYLDLTQDEKARLFEALPALETLVREEQIEDPSD